MNDLKLLHEFYTLLNEIDKETALNNDKMKLFSYCCGDITKYIKEVNMIERETKLIENFIYELYAGNSIYHDYVLLSKENDNLNNSIIEEGISKSLAEKIFTSFIHDLNN